MIPVGIAGRAPRPRVLAGGGAERKRGVLNFPLELHRVQGQVDGGVNPLEETNGGGGEEEEKEEAKVGFSHKHGSVGFLPNFSVQISRKMRALPQKSSEQNICTLFRKSRGADMTATERSLLLGIRGSADRKYRFPRTYVGGLQWGIAISIWRISKFV